MARAQPRVHRAVLIYNFKLITLVAIFTAVHQAVFKLEERHGVTEFLDSKLIRILSRSCVLPGTLLVFLGQVTSAVLAVSMRLARVERVLVERVYIFMKRGAARL